MKIDYKTLVNQILADKRNAARKEGKGTGELEAEVDVLVYALYGLTAAEVAVITEASA